ncbi:MAG: tRNA-dihydrouridine synthase, partial [Planctomycetota bacterium]
MTDASAIPAFKPLRMGPITLHAPMMQAGLAGYSDRAMRVVARRRGCPYAVTEAVLDQTLLAGGKGLKQSIDIDDDDHPVAGQIMGSDPAEMAAAAKIMADHGYDVVDLNFACPVKKVKRRARGGWMLADVDRGLAILRGVRDALPDHPLSVSLRRGFDDSGESEDRFWTLAHAARELGLVAMRVHGRTVEQKYTGRSRRPFLGSVKQTFPDWIVWGSGDVFEPEDVVDMLRETGVDGVWIARGAIGNPWIFRDARKLLAGEIISPPTIAKQRNALDEHFALAMDIHGEQLAGRRMRKLGIKYARFHPDAADVKKRFIATKCLADWSAVLADFYDRDGPGVRPPREIVDEV